MIESPWLRKLLSIASKHSERRIFKPFHEAVRLFYLGPGALFLEKILRPKNIKKEDFKLLIRHSSKTRNDFNAFLSDIDLTVVMADSCIEDATQVVKRYHFTKAFLLAVGELEIYSNSELLAYQRQLDIFGDLYLWVRGIRKLAWMEKALTEAPSDYHRLKARRSIAKILSNTNISESSDETIYRSQFSKKILYWLDQEFSQALKVSQFEVQRLQAQSEHSDYLSSRVYFEAGQKLKFGELYLPNDYALILLALTPMMGFENKEIEVAVEQIRSKDLKLQKVWGAFSKIESIVYGAVLRAQRHITEGERGWLQLFINSRNRSEFMASQGEAELW